MITAPWPPRRVYKYVDAKDAHFLEEGSVKIGSLRGYAALEGARSDSGEGTASHRLERKFDLLNPGEPDADIMSQLGIEVRGPMIDCSFEVDFLDQSPDFYCLCFSDRSDIDHPDGTEQAVFEIKHVRRLTTLLKELCPQLGSSRTGRITYRSRAMGDPFANGRVEVNPFIKPETFAWEREVRALWSPATDDAVQAPIYVNDDRIKDLIKRLR
jgi:hypothetical protein